MTACTAITKYSEIVSRALQGDDILYASLYDISEDGRYTEGVIAVGRKAFCIVEDGKIIYVRKIADIEKMCCGEYVGGGMLEEFSDGGRKGVVRFSMNYIEKFNTVCEIINDLCEGNEPIIKEEEPQKVCPKCKRPLLKGQQNLQALRK